MDHKFLPPPGLAPSVGEYGVPCRKLPLTCGHLAKFGGSYISYHNGVILGSQKLGTFLKVADDVRP